MLCKQLFLAVCLRLCESWDRLEISLCSRWWQSNKALFHTLPYQSTSASLLFSVVRLCTCLPRLWGQKIDFFKFTENHELCTGYYGSLGSTQQFVEESGTLLIGSYSRCRYVRCVPTKALWGLSSLPRLFHVLRAITKYCFNLQLTLTQSATQPTTGHCDPIVCLNKC